MLKTSFRLPEETLQKLAQMAERCHNGNRTAALTEAVERYARAVLDPVQPVGWISVRVNAKPRCAKCHNPIDGPGFVLLSSDGAIATAAHCSKCAR
jgi:hypothetical protein